MVSLIEVGVLLIKHFDLHEGLYDVNVEFKLAVASVGPAPETRLPSVIAGVSRLGLSRVTVVGTHTVDASKVNPAKTIKKIQPKKAPSKSVKSK